MEFTAGIHVRRAAEQMVARVRESGATVTASFNGIRLEATAGMTAGDVVAGYDAESNRRVEEWRRSPEGRAFRARQEAEVDALKCRRDELLRQLDALDFGDLDAVLAWLCGIQEASEHRDVGVPHELILRAFREHGFEPNANVGDQCDPEDRENVARYIVGQALDGLECHDHAIHPVFKGFTDDWRRKFGTAKV